MSGYAILAEGVPRKGKIINKWYIPKWKLLHELGDIIECKKMCEGHRSKLLSKMLDLPEIHGVLILNGYIH